MTRVSGAERSAASGREKGERRALYGRSRLAMKVDADVKDEPAAPAAPAASPGTPNASYTELPGSSFDGLLV